MHPGLNLLTIISFLFLGVQAIGFSHLRSSIGGIANGMPRNYIPTGDETQVRGTKRMLKDKKKTAKWY